MRYFFLFDEQFPVTLPTVYAPSAEALYLENPHVLNKGVLCIVPESSSVNTKDIEAVLNYYINSTRKILSGTNDVDFRDEFSIYWNKKLNHIDKVCLIVSSPEVLGNSFFVYWGEKVICISHDEVELNNWCTNFFSNTTQHNSELDGFTLMIDSPLVPKEYPETYYDLLVLAKRKDPDVFLLLIDKFVNTTKPILVLLKQKTATGYSLGCVEINALGLKNFTSLQHGFRVGHTPNEVLINRSTEILKGNEVTRYLVTRTDYDWIHSRGGDGRSYVDKAVVIIGCGSLGGYIAHSLAKSGVGKLLLVDNEMLEWSNIGRHVLGADYVYSPKADSLKKSLLKEMPHLTIEARVGKWQTLLEKEDGLFNNYDLIISSIANWRFEKPLNSLSMRKLIPPVLFTWLEPFAVVGHCHISFENNLGSNFDDLGRFQLAVTEFKTLSMRREPGGCTFYQPYGLTGLLNTVSMVTKASLNYLLNSQLETKLHTWISDKDHIMRTNAEITECWDERIKIQGYSRVYETELISKESEG